MSTQVVSPKGQFSYPNLFKARRNNLNKDDKREFYSVDILFDKSADLSKLNEGIQAELEKKLGADKTKYPKKLNLPIKDGDEKGTPEYAGKFYITCKADASRGKIQIFDKTRKVLESESDIVGGDFGHVLLNFYYYDANGNKGVSAGLNGVMLVEKTSEPFSGSKSAFEAFESLAEDVYEQQNSEMFK